MVPFADLKQQHERIREELDEALAEVISTCRFVGGPVLDSFAEEFAAYCGVKHVVPCGNGTEALRLALLGVLGEGDGGGEVVTVSHTFAATTESIIAAGYKPVLVDVDPATFLMDIEAAEAAINQRTVAIAAVHLYGQMVDMKRLRAVADRHNLAVIEDAAQAHGARFDGVGPGQAGEAASYSFFPGKNLGAFGDAGAVACNDDAIARKIAQLADHGRTDKFTHTRVGCNGRMDTLQAAVLRVKLRHLDRWNDARRQAAGWYRELLADQPEISLPAIVDQAQHVYHQFVVQVRRRDPVRKELGESGIATGIHYPVPVHEQPAYRNLGLAPESLPATHALCQRILSLPIFPEITYKQAEEVAQILIRACSPAASHLCCPVGSSDVQ